MNYTDTRQRLISINAKFGALPEGWGFRINLSGANLSGADLSGADLSGANLSGANLSGADLSGADLSGANLSGADLSGANLSGANLSGANLSGANLSGADLSGADLSGADLSGANLSGANLRGADLSGAIGVIVVQFAGFTMYIQAKMARIGCKYKSHEEWLAVGVDLAVAMGIRREHYEAYRAFLIAGAAFFEETEAK